MLIYDLKTLHRMSFYRKRFTLLVRSVLVNLCQVVKTDLSVNNSIFKVLPVQRPGLSIQFV